MRDLIKPTLFIVARLGLFLAVVAWIVGQWLEVRFQSRSFPEEAQVVFNDLGWITKYFDGVYHDYVKLGHSNNWAPKVGPNNQMRTALDYPSWLPVGYRFPGVFFTLDSGLFMSLRHWLVVTLLAAFNIFLHWFYRKRQEVQPCES